MKSLVFDTGPIISLTLNNLSWLLDPLKKQFKGEFYLTEGVKKELIDKPLDINKFKFEALHALKFIREKTLNIYPEKDYEKETAEILKIANSIFSARDRDIHIVHEGEVETIALAIRIKATAIVVDERTTTELIENPDHVFFHLKKKLHTKIKVNKNLLNEFKEMTKDVRVINSVDLMLAAYEMGLLDRYLPDKPYRKELLLDAILWGLKLNGCAISDTEIEMLINRETGRVN